MEPSEGSVLRFLVERGGRAPNAELLDHFRAFLNSPEPHRRALARERFKEAVNAVATVKQEPGSGAKYVQVRKKYRKNHNATAINGPSQSESLREGKTEEKAEEETLESDMAPSSSSSSSSPSSSGARGQPEGTRMMVTVGTEDGGKEREEEEAEAEGEEEASPPSPPSSSSSLLGFPAALTATNTAPLPLRSGRKAFRERRMLGSSPQMKRGGGGTRGGRGSSAGAGDSDSVSVASSSSSAAAEEEAGVAGASVALDPLEHAWMLSASEGRWESLEALLGCEPALLAKRDFVTGFSCLHWAAKLGRAELLALLVAFARRRGLPLDIDARTAAGGYTALHLAALHGHLEVVKLLVGAYDADVELRDYSGRKAAHYLLGGRGRELRGLVGGAEEEEEEEEAEGGGGGGGGSGGGGVRWRLSRVLPAQLLASRLPHHHQGEEAEQEGKGRELSRKSGGGGGGSGRSKGPRGLHKIRFRTQIVHTTPSFRGGEGEDGEEGPQERTLRGSSSFKLRPKSNVFG